MSGCEETAPGEEEPSIPYQVIDPSYGNNLILTQTKPATRYHDIFCLAGVKWNGLPANPHGKNSKFHG